MIQLYVKRSDLIRSEGYNFAQVEELTKDVISNGFLDSLNIKPDGYVLRGNTRANTAIKLGIDYLPISLRAFIGLYVNSDGEHIRIRKSIIDHYELSNDADYRKCEKVIDNHNHIKNDFSVPMKVDDSFYYYKQEYEYNG